MDQLRIGSFGSSSSDDVEAYISKIGHPKFSFLLGAKNIVRYWYVYALLNSNPASVSGRETYTPGGPGYSSMNYTVSFDVLGVFSLNDDTKILSGTGIENDPFILEAQ